jgi:hypothetical protein
MSDMAGRIILNGHGAFSGGAHETKLDLQQLARGIYYMTLDNGRGVSERLKLVLQ